MGHGDDTGRRIERDGRDEIGMDSMWSLSLKELRNFTLSHDHATHAGANNHADTMGRFFGHDHTRIGQGFLGGDQGELGVAIDPVGLCGRQVLFWRKVMHLPGHL